MSFWYYKTLSKKTKLKKGLSELFLDWFSCFLKVLDAEP